jgi:hypothetical protein
MQSEQDKPSSTEVDLGTSQVSLMSLRILMDGGLPRAVRRSFAIGSATEPLRVSSSTSVESRRAVQ